MMREPTAADVMAAIELDRHMVQIVETCATEGETYRQIMRRVERVGGIIDRWLDQFEDEA